MEQSNQLSASMSPSRIAMVSDHQSPANYNMNTHGAFHQSAPYINSTIEPPNVSLPPINPRKRRLSDGVGASILHESLASPSGSPGAYHKPPPDAELLRQLGIPADLVAPIQPVQRHARLPSLPLALDLPVQAPPAKRSRVNTPWTPAEEQRLKLLRDAGQSWGEIAKSFPNRTEGSVKKHWYKDMHYAEFQRDDSTALLHAIQDYEQNKWKVIGAKVGKPAKACEQYARDHFTKDQMAGKIKLPAQRKSSPDDEKDLKPISD